MIVPMEHVSILCLEKERNSAVKSLAGAGVLHVEVSLKDSQEIAKSSNHLQKAIRAKECIKEVLSVKKINEYTFQPSIDSSEKIAGIDIGDKIININFEADEYLKAKQSYDKLEQLINKYLPWGDFDPKTISKLSENGVNVVLFVEKAPYCDVSEMNSYVEIYKETDTERYGVFVGNESVPESFRVVELPSEPIRRTIERQNACMGRMEQAISTIKAEAESLNKLDDEIAYRENSLEMVSVAESSLNHGVVCCIEGFLPVRNKTDIEELAKKNGWGYSFRKPLEEESVPTLLEPPKIFRPIMCVYKLIDILPGYREDDVSIPFYVFFSLFFAMLIGDAGYGLLILLASLFAKFKMKKKGEISPFAKSCFTLVNVFALSTIVYGVLSGTYFGIVQSALPEFLKFKTLTWFSNYDNVMQLCFTIGLVHLLLGRIWNTLSLFPNLKFLGEIGWGGATYALYNIVCGIVINGYTTPSWNNVFFGISIVLIVIGYCTSKAELKANAMSLAMLPLNIISGMGDIISYIRLFAVGLASVKVAENFNMIAVDLDMALIVKIPLMILILLLGHGMNFILGGLSILVHAVRLNTLEFSGVKGISWAGTTYRPLEMKKQNSSKE